MLVNLTPYSILGDPQNMWTIPPSGVTARAIELVTPADPIDGIPTAYIECYGVRDLPGPADDRWYVISMVTAQAAKQWGRVTHDLLTSGEQICDTDGKIIGYKCLQRVQ
jgi:hypothetical protein